MYAEYVACRLHELIKLPDSIDLEQAIAIPNFRVAWAIFNDAADPRRCRTVYVNGATGGVGVAIMQICQTIGSQVIAVASSRAKYEFALADGQLAPSTEPKMTRLPEQ